MAWLKKSQLGVWAEVVALHIVVVGLHIDVVGFVAGLLCNDVEVEASGRPHPSLLLGSPENLKPGYCHVHSHSRCHWHGIHAEVRRVGQVDGREWPSGPWEGCVWMKVQKKTLLRTY